MFERVRAYADLAAGDDRILEIGAGTGRATAHIAQWPHDITALEPAPAMADIARLQLASFDNVEIIETTFEDWDLQPSTFGMVLCSLSYHWLDPDTRDDRIADALYAHGTAVIFDDIQVVTDATVDFFERVLDVYREHTPHLVHQGGFLTADSLPAHRLTGHPRFVDLTTFDHGWEWTLPTEDYVSLMCTHSSHAALDDDVRERLHSGIAKLIDDDFGGSVTENYVARAAVARRVD